METYNPLVSPDVSGLVPNVVNVDPASLNTYAPGTPGDVIQLDGSTFNMTFGKEISGFRGTQENPIWILGNGSAYDGKTLELLDNQWTYFENINSTNSTSTGILIEDSQNCIYKDITVSDPSNNGILIQGTTINPNSDLAFFDNTITNWGIDGMSFHASSTEENNGNNFIVQNLTTTNSPNVAEGGLDVTSGDNFHIHNYTGVNGSIEIGHGVTDVYIKGMDHTWDIASTNDKSISVKNTDGDIWITETTGDGKIDLGINSNTRSNETPNSTLSLYITHELKVWDNNLTSGIDNNTSGSGTIVTNMPSNLINDLSLNEFIEWPSI